MFMFCLSQKAVNSMKNPFRFISKGIRILTRRLREQGLRTTLIWMYGRGLPKLTGVPLLNYSEITPHLFVGPQHGKRGKARLEDAGIAYCINMRIEYDDDMYGVALQNYCHLPTIDDDAPTMEHLHQGIAFIQQAINAGGKVYIHCAGGIGRAPTMAAAYLMSTGQTLDDAIAQIKAKRPFIKIMPPQMTQLRRLEAELFQPEMR
jgi:hypothetical protein